ncbi:hypothetical protein [Miltoncostaea marina]|uniref:hypothetical protein n=1 Tax=Miltoncostaea marina TaxID=2843215 RepID=UPI001C3CDF2B|nr:hypothetical protein [Miltoncostaea marina]
MAAYFQLVLDTTPPAGVSVVMNGGDPATGSRDVTLSIATTDPDTTGYQVKIYGDVDDAHAPAEYRATEANAPWVTYVASKGIRLSAGDGTKTVRIKVRDDVGNASAEASDTIVLDTTAPVVTVGTPSAAKISKVAGYDESVFDWEADEPFEEYKVLVVQSQSATHTQGTQIPTTAGSANVAGSAGGYPAATPITTTVKGADYEAAGGDADSYVKVFVRDSTGTWSL